MAYRCINGGECGGCGDCLGSRDACVCPVCGGRCKIIYINIDGDVVGFEKCVSVERAEDIERNTRSTDNE